MFSIRSYRCFAGLRWRREHKSSRPCESHWPRMRRILKPAFANIFRLLMLRSDARCRATRCTKSMRATRVPALSWPPHWPRPSRLLDPPEHIETVALLPDHPPAAFTWRGQRRRVARADGPERIFANGGKRKPKRTRFAIISRSRMTRATLLAVSRWRRRGSEDRLTEMVSAWGVRVTRYAKLQCASHFSFLRRSRAARGPSRPYCCGQVDRLFSPIGLH